MSLIKSEAGETGIVVQRPIQMITTSVGRRLVVVGFFLLHFWLRMGVWESD